MQPQELALTCSDCGASRGLTGDAEEDAYMLLDLVEFLRQHEHCAARVAIAREANVPGPRPASDPKPVTER